MIRDKGEGVKIEMGTSGVGQRQRGDGVQIEVDTGGVGQRERRRCVDRNEQGGVGAEAVKEEKIVCRKSMGSGKLRAAVEPRR